MADKPPPTLRLRVDKDALAHNWRELDRLSGAAKAGAAVKANCYGLGVDACVPTLRDAGAERFFVAHWSEVEALLPHLDPASIRVLHGAGNHSEAAYARAMGVVPVINSLHQARIWQESGGGSCDLMVDTGINRLGISPSEAAETVVQSLEVECLMSHLACADEDSLMNARQLVAFQQVRAQIPHQTASLANSAGIALGRDYAFDMTRPGLALYGGIPRGELDGVIHQVGFPEVAIMQRRTIEAGESVGYNAEFTADRQMNTAIVSLGYADGFLRLWRKDAVLIHGDRSLRLLGKISMDMVVIDLTDAPDLQEGDWLSVPYDLKNAAQQTSLSQYELLTILGRRWHG